MSGINGEEEKIIIGPDGQELPDTPVASIYMSDIIREAERAEYDFWEEVFPILYSWNGFLKHLHIDKRTSIIVALDSTVGLPKAQKIRFKGGCSHST